MNEEDLLIRTLEAKDETIYEMRREISDLRTRITYLQEELSSAEMELDQQRARYEAEITHLEGTLDNVLLNQCF